MMIDEFTRKRARFLDISRDVWTAFDTGVVPDAATAALVDEWMSLFAVGRPGVCAGNRGRGEGGVDAESLRAAYLATSKAAASIVGRADYSEAMAASAAVASLRDRAIDAATDASRESARAITWDVDNPSTWREEAVWQCVELRRIVGPDAQSLAADVRRNTRGALHVL